jgi:hypothetical protein
LSFAADVIVFLRALLVAGLLSGCVKVFEVQLPEVADAGLFARALVRSLSALVGKV